jgi:hypothetical protein
VDERGWSGFGRVGFVRIYREQVHSGSRCIRGQVHSGSTGVYGEPLKSTIKPNPLFGSPYSLKLSPHPTAPLHPLYPLGPSSPVASRRPAPQRIDEVQAGEAATQCVARGEGPQHRRAQERLCRHAVTELDTQRLGGRVVAAVAGTPAKPYSVLGRVQR